MSKLDVSLAVDMSSTEQILANLGESSFLFAIRCLRALIKGFNDFT